MVDPCFVSQPLQPGGDQGALAFLGQLAHNASHAAAVLSNVELLVFPRYNPDGVSCASSARPSVVRTAQG